MLIDVETALQAASELLAPWATEPAHPEPNRLDATMAAADLVAAVAALDDARWGNLTAITGLDLEAAAVIEVLYHFCAGAAVVTLRVQTPRADARVPSVCGVIPSATLFERELSEMLGVKVAGTPNSDRLFLPDDWPDGVYPLRKDFRPAG